MIVFTADCDRDLKREEAAASMARPIGAGAGKKKKEVGASERRIPLARLLPNESTAEARPDGAGKKMEQATVEARSARAGKKMEQATAEARPTGAAKKMEQIAAEARPAGAGKEMEQATAEKNMKEAVDVVSESGDGALKKETEGDSLFKEGEMLKLWEELREAERLWREKLVPGALDAWLESKSMLAVDEKKKKVVRVILPNDYVDYIKKNPGMMSELSDEEMAKCPERFRQTYAITKLINAKNRAYQQALIDQYGAFGFAYDEKEVTDDDEKVPDEEEVVVVKN